MSRIRFLALCNQHHAEPCFALHHASVSIGGLFERNCLDHGSDVLQDAESKCVLAVNRRPGQAPEDRAPSKDERKRIHLDRVLRYTDHDDLAAGCKTGHKCSHGITTGSCCENRPRPAQTLQYCRGILGGRIDVDVCAQIFRQLFLLASTPDCHGMESHVPRKLNTKMPKATNTLDRNQIYESVRRCRQEE